MNLLAVIDLLCDITTQQSDLLRKLVTELEHTKQVSQEVKSYYREAFENIEKQLEVSEYNSRTNQYLINIQENVDRVILVNEVSETRLLKEWSKGV